MARNFVEFSGFSLNLFYAIHVYTLLFLVIILVRLKSVDLIQAAKITYEYQLQIYYVESRQNVISSCRQIVIEKRYYIHNRICFQFFLFHQLYPREIKTNYDCFTRKSVTSAFFCFIITVRCFSNNPHYQSRTSYTIIYTT